MATPALRRGRVYRTEYLTKYTRNPSRLAARLVQDGKLRRLRKGMYYVPGDKVGSIEVPPSERALLRAFFRGRPYLYTGNVAWNSLGLGTTAVEAVGLIYNTTRTGRLEIDGRRFDLRRVRFPRKPEPEYYVIDLLNNLVRAMADAERVQSALERALANGRFDVDVLARRAAQIRVAHRRGNGPASASSVMIGPVGSRFPHERPGFGKLVSAVAKMCGVQARTHRKTPVVQT